MKTLWLVFFLLSTCCYSQTVVIAKITKNSIYVGADSRAIEVKIDVRNWHSDTTFSDFCKIRKIGKYYFAVVHDFAEESIELINNASINAKNLNDLIYIYVRKFRLFLINKLQEIKSENEKYYYNYYPPDSLLCHTIFFGYESDTAILRGVTFLNEEDKNNTINVSVTYWHDTAIAAGEATEIKPIVKDPNTWHRNPKKVIYTLIKKQCDRHPTTVGKPIHIIRVSKNGYKWVMNGCD